VGDDIAGVATAIDALFEQLVEILENNDLHGILVIVEQILVEDQHVLVGLALQELEFIVELLDPLQVVALAQAFDEFQDEVRRLLEEADLDGEIGAVDVLGSQPGAFTEFLD
jgi:hypothetical protein